MADERYIGRFSQMHGGRVYRIDIYNGAGTTEIVIPDRGGKTADPCYVKTLSFSRDEDPVVVGSELKFDFILPERANEADYDPLFECEDKDFIVQLRDNSTLDVLWQGYLQPEHTYKDVFEPNTHIFISATDGLMDLANYEFLDDSDEVINSRELGIDIIRTALNKIGFEFDLLFQTNIQVPGEGFSLFSYCDFDCRRFHRNNNGKIDVDGCLVALEKLLRPFNCKIRQVGGDYVIQNQYEYETNVWRYAWDWASPTLPEVRSLDAIDIDLYTYRRNASISMLPPIREVDIILRNINLGESLVEELNNFATMDAWNFTDFNPPPYEVFVRRESIMNCIIGRLYAAPDSQIMTLASAFAITRRTDSDDYLIVNFESRIWAVTNGTMTEATIDITITRPDLTEHTYAGIPVNFDEWTRFESPVDAVFNCPADGNYTVTFKINDNGGAGSAAHCYLRRFEILHGQKVGDKVYANRTVDQYWRLIRNDTGGKIRIEQEFFFGDAPLPTDQAAIQHGGALVDEWSSPENIGDHRPLLEIWAQYQVIARYFYKNYLIIDVLDRGDTITPERIIVFRDRIYDIVSYSKSFRTSWVQLHLRERFLWDPYNPLTEEGTMHKVLYEELAFLTSIDGRSTEQPPEYLWRRQ